MGNAHGGKKNESRKSLSDNLVRDEKRQIKDTYDVVEQALGKGTSTQIKQATSKKYSKTTRSSGVAIKLYDGKSELPLDLKQEAKILSQCDHPNIVRLYELAKNQKQMSLVMELCTGGSVMDRMPYTEKKASHIMRQVTSAIAYLHNKNIVHRDIELTNILFETKDEDSDVKLIDFGCATQLELVPGHPGAFKFLKERTGSVHVMAPEVLKGRYGPKADIWSLGVCAYMLLNNGQHPFKGASVEELERKIIQGSIDYRGWPHSDAAKNFVQETAKVNAGQRLTAANALKHVWIEHTVAKSTLPNELVVSLDLYRLAPPLKRVALNALAQKSIASKYRGLFVDLDTTQSGTLTHEEFMEGFKNSGSSPEELKDLFLKLDINGNGEILYTEFLAATLEAEGELEEGQLQEAFDLIDKDHSGYITKKDLMKMFGNPTGTSSSSSPVKATKAVEKTVHKTLDTLHLDKIPFVVNVKKFVDDIFTEKDRIPYEDFAQLFEHGFDARPSMDTIVETSLNEEQLSRLQEDDREEHMTAIRESDE